MGNTIVAGTTLTNPLETHFPIRGKERQVAASGTVLTITYADRSPNHSVMVLGDITAAEATTLKASCTAGASISITSDGFGGAVNVICDGFGAIIEAASGRGVGRVYYHP